MSEVKSERGPDHVDLPQSGLNDLDAAAEPIRSASAVKLIFLHSSWRTSSTWFWAKFRPFPETACYYEPFNDELTTIEHEKAASVHDTSWDSRHPPVDPYRLEFLPMIQPTGGVQLFEPSMHLDWFTPVGGLRGELRPAEIQYLALLIDCAREQGKIPVFGETRSLGRIWAIQKSFGGFHVFLHRNLWRQWLSYLYYRRRSNHYFYETTAVITARSADPFLADVANFYVERALDLCLRRDGEEHRPLSDDERVRLLRLLPESDAFAMFMALHVYLYLHAQLTVDLTVDVTKLAKDSVYLSHIENELARQTGLEISLSDVANGQSARGVAISAAVIDWDEIREHARLAVQILSAFGDPTKLMENATEFVDSAFEELHKSEAALAMRGDAADEIWYARLQDARCHWELGDHDGFVRQALDLRNERPQRAEPLYDLARFHRERGMHETAADFAEAGLAIERPGHDAGFVEDLVYLSGLREELSIAAFYCRNPARKERGFAACNWLALSRDIPEGTRSLARGHLQFYVAPASTLMPSFTARPVDFMPPEGWHATNPSVARRGDGIVIVQRAVNYVLESGDNRTPDSAPIATRNFLLRLNPTLDIESAVEILPPSDLPAPVYGLALGFEDLRLFSWRGALWCSAALLELTPQGWCQQALARIDESADGQCRLADWRVLAPEGPPRHEKNWMPLVEPTPAAAGGEALRFISHCDPTRLIDHTAQAVAETTPAIAAEQFRGGTQAIKFDGGWLALVHEASSDASGGDRAHNHRFVWFDESCALRGVSRPFFLQKQGVEFAAGLAWHPDCGRLIISYAVRDGKAWIATVDAAEVRAVLEDATRLPSGKQSAADVGTVGLGAIRMPAAESTSSMSSNKPCSEANSVSGRVVSNAPRKLAFIIAPTDHGTMIVNRFDYYLLEQDRSFGVGFQLLEKSCYEPDEINFLLRLLDRRRQYYGDGVVAIDCGANIGVHTIEFAKHMTGWGTVLGFEAQEPIYYALAGNIAINNCFNARAIHAALTSQPGTMKIPAPNYSISGSFGSLELRKRDNTEWIGQPIDYSESRMVDVQAINLDSLNFIRLDLMKIDVEGMELEVLAGGAKCIHDLHPILQVETLKTDQNALRAWLEGLGYSVVTHGINFLAIHRDDKCLGHI
jgi:FkbM family methyltransferase